MCIRDKDFAFAGSSRDTSPAGVPQLGTGRDGLVNNAEDIMKRLAILCIALLLTAFGAPTASAQSGADLFQQALQKERVEGDLKAAIALYQRILEQHAADRALSARVLVQLGQAYEKMGTADA